jgi:hypothetical protein
MKLQRLALLCFLSLVSTHAQASVYSCSVLDHPHAGAGATKTSEIEIPMNSTVSMSLINGNKLDVSLWNDNNPSAAVTLEAEEIFPDNTIAGGGGGAGPYESYEGKQPHPQFYSSEVFIDCREKAE